MPGIGLMGVGLGKGWEGVPLPSSGLNYLPHYVFDDADGTFSLDPDFNLERLSNIHVRQTYYVATTGSDSNPGTSGSPFKTMGKAIGMADVDRIYVAAGWYKSWDSAMNEPTRSIEIIGVGNVYITQDWSANLSWVADDSHYRASTGAVILAVMDKSATDVNGDWSLLTLVADEATVDSTPGSWWLDDPNNLLYMQTSDSRTPDSNIAVFFSTASIVAWTIDNLTVYIENIKFIGASGGVVVSNASSAGKATRAYFKDCEVDCLNVAGYGFNANGISDFILQNCVAKRCDNDGVRIMTLNSVVTHAFEIDCTMRNCGQAGDSAINGSSSHSDGTVIRVNGSYHHTYGRPVHDYNNGKQWLLGVHGNDELSGGLANFEITGTTGETWCDQCVSANSDYDYAESGGANLHKHSCTGDATDGAGVDTYTY